MGVPVPIAQSIVVWDRSLEAQTAVGIPARSWRRFGGTRILGGLDIV